jgi:putative oxidoreductase
MFQFLSSHSSMVLGAMRILLGINFAVHGAQKLFGVFGGAPAEMPLPLLYPAGGVELVGGVLVALGLFTRPAAFICSGLMAAAYFMAHAPQGFWPILNRGELAIAYCWMFLYIAAAGPGAWSLDGIRAGDGDRTPAEA